MGCPAAAELLSPGRLRVSWSRSTTGDDLEELDQKIILKLLSFQGYSFGLRHLICQSDTHLLFLEWILPKLRV